MLGIIGLVIGGIWTAAAAVQLNLRTNRLVAGTLLIVDNIKTLYRNIPADGITTAGLISAGVIPRDLISGTEIKSPWGDTITVMVNNDTLTFDGQTRYITIHFPDTFGGKRCNAYLRSVLAQSYKDYRNFLIFVEIDDLESDDFFPYNGQTDPAPTPQEWASNCGPDGYKPEHGLSLNFKF